MKDEHPPEFSGFDPHIANAADQVVGWRLARGHGHDLDGKSVVVGANTGWLPAASTYFNTHCPSFFTA